MTSETNLTKAPVVQTSRVNLHFSVLVGVSLLLCLPCLLYGFPFYGDDSLSHAILYSQFAKQFWSGELYPRWLQELNAGLGDPTGYYYPPLSYWLASLSRPLFREDPNGWHQLGISATVAVLLSGLAVFCWLRRTVDASSALLASIVYLILPYHLHTDLYGRGALAELWAFVWMPLILWMVEAIIRQRPLAVVGLAAAYGALVLTHLPTTVVFSPVPIGYVLFCAPAGKRISAIYATITSLLLGAGLAAIYLLPAMFMQGFIFHTTEGISGHYYFGNWFLFTGLTWSGRHSDFFFVSLVGMMLAGVAFVLAHRIATNLIKKTVWFWFVVAVGCFSMMLPLSKPLWELLPVLQKIQFPFRFNTVLSVAAVSLVAFAYFSKPRPTRVILISLLALFGISSLYVTAFRAYYAYPIHHYDQPVNETAQKRLALKRVTNEFRPRWVTSIDEQPLDDLLTRIGMVKGELNRVRVVRGEASVVVEKWTPREISLRVQAAEGTELNVSQFYFPGWIVSVNDAEARAAAPSKPGGLLQISVPAGNHQVLLQLRQPAPEFAGKIISGVSLIVLLALVVVSAVRGRRP